MLNESCNLRCSYCFASDLMNSSNENSSEITLNNFKKAVNFCCTSRNSRIGLIGGEPLLYSKFREAIEYLAEIEAIRNVIIFTNGVLLYNFLELVQNDKFSFLVNCNSPQVIGQDNYRKLRKSIDVAVNQFAMADRITLGLNIYSNKMDSNFIFDLLEEFNIKKLRISIAAPNSKVNEKVDSLSEYAKLKDITLNIVLKALRNDIFPYFDCNQLPLCLITNKERNEIASLFKNGVMSNVISINTSCEPTIDIKTDLTVMRCMGLYAYATTNMDQFDNLLDLEQYFRTQIDDYKNIVPTDTRCRNCKLNLIKRCSGGCLCYKIDRINKCKDIIAN